MPSHPRCAWPPPLLAALLALSLILVNAAHAAADAQAAADGDAIHEVSVEDPRRGTEHRLRLWLPPGVEPVRGAIIQPMFAGLVERADYRRLAADLEFALIGCQLDRRGDMAHAVTTALKQFARETGRPEIEHLPLIASGFSAGGGMAIRLGYHLPERMIAVWSNGNPGIGLPIDADPEQLARYRTVPTLTVNGSRDPFVDYDKAPQRYWHNAHHPRIREARLQWGLAMQWGHAHVYGRTNDLAWPFIAEVIRLRLPEDHDPRTGSPTLRTIPEQDGYLGDIRTWETPFPTIAPFDGDKVADTSWTWLPTEGTAILWRGFTARNRPIELTITADAEDGGHTLTVEGDLPENIAEVVFHRIGQPIGRRDSPPYRIHTDALDRVTDAAIAIVTLDDGSQLTTAPVLPPPRE